MSRDKKEDKASTITRMRNKFDPYEYDDNHGIRLSIALEIVNIIKHSVSPSMLSPSYSLKLASFAPTILLVLLKIF